MLLYIAIGILIGSVVHAVWRWLRFEFGPRRSDGGTT
jgi:hypothetical protein